MRVSTPPLPQYAFMAWCSVERRHRDNFTFTFTEVYCVNEEAIMFSIYNGVTRMRDYFCYIFTSLNSVFSSLRFCVARS
jgi:hypothetical protein